jgi:hypothetical protein
MAGRQAHIREMLSSNADQITVGALSTAKQWLAYYMRGAEFDLHVAS